MIRFIKESGKWIGYEFDPDESELEQVKALVEYGDLVILCEELEQFEQLFPSAIYEIIG